ncbi:MAG: hypothetical protein JWP75_1277, partial [Frondihabitans sp.]|nr:hypothetical protein [Frondihabitans sp.]
VMGAVTTGVIWVPDPMPSLPVVLSPVPVVPDPVPVVVLLPVLVESPRTEIAFPAAVTGAVTTGAIWVPPRTLPVPVVVAGVPDAVLDPVVLDPAVVVLPVLVELPRTEMPLPETVTGRLTPTRACVPDTTPSEPLVDGAAVDAVGVAAVVEEPVLDELPSTEMPLPETVTGTVTFTSAWLPPATEPLPVVVAAGVVAAGAAAAGAAVVAWLELESPATDTALPETVTGTWTETMPWVPERMPEVPVVVGAAAGAAAGVAAGAAWVVDAVDVELPRTLIALPVAVTGAVTAPTTWLPEAMPSEPVVVAAFAAVAPTAQRPPTKQAPMSPRKTYLFMVQLLNQMIRSTHVWWVVQLVMVVSPEATCALPATEKGRVRPSVGSCV